MTAQELQALIYRARQYVATWEGSQSESRLHTVDLINELVQSLERSEQSLLESKELLSRCIFPIENIGCPDLNTDDDLLAAVRAFLAKVQA